MGVYLAQKRWTVIANISSRDHTMQIFEQNKLLTTSSLCIYSCLLLFFKFMLYHDEMRWFITYINTVYNTRFLNQNNLCIPRLALGLFAVRFFAVGIFVVGLFAVRIFRRTEFSPKGIFAVRNFRRPVFSPYTCLGSSSLVNMFSIRNRAVRLLLSFTQFLVDPVATIIFLLAWSEVSYKI